MSVNIRITKDNASPAVQQVIRDVAPRAIAQKLDAPLLLLMQANFAAQGTNKQGWPSTGFWANAVRATGTQILDDGLLLRCDWQGVRQRYYGGDISAGVGTSSKTGEATKYLAIAARQEAYGKNPSEFDDLVPVFRWLNGQLKVIGLAEAPATQVKQGHQRKDGTIHFSAAGEQGGGIMYFLVETVHQQADPSVLPTDEQFFTAIDKALLTLTKN